MSTSLTKNTIYIIPIEPIDQRYTKQWFYNIPQIIEEATDKYEVKTVEGVTVADVTTRGAFLDFALTNAYKASQVEKISGLFSHGIIKPGDRFLVTDAWHFGITAIKYMSELLDVPVEIHGIWHAGHYDPTDILGMKMTKWAVPFEKCVHECLDYNYFATEFHRDLFLRNLHGDFTKCVVSGQPHSPIIKPLLEMSTKPKEDIVIFPHRLNSDKQPEIARDLANNIPFIINQELNLSKDEYYECLSQCKVLFSCALHENLGISVMEGCLAGALPLVPDRASYSEMYLDTFLYPSEWTASFEAYQSFKPYIMERIRDMIVNYNKYYYDLVEQRNILIDKYLTPTVMIENLIR